MNYANPVFYKASPARILQTRVVPCLQGSSALAAALKKLERYMVEDHSLVGDHLSVGRRAYRNALEYLVLTKSLSCSRKPYQANAEAKRQATLYGYHEHEGSWSFSLNAAAALRFCREVLR